MIGQHPRAHGFPELNLFVAETVRDMLEFHLRYQHVLESLAQCPTGLLRALSEVFMFGQTSEKVARARDWIEARIHWSTRQVWDALLQGIHPRLGIDKSPVTSLSPGFLQRARRLYPQARFLHLTRHPGTALPSILKQFRQVIGRLQPGCDERAQLRFCARLWFLAHRDILEFTSGMPAEQTLRLRGEDLLAHPDQHLRLLARWLGIPEDVEAIDAMKHPERSPYARYGPVLARGGNDPKFLRDPYLRPPPWPDSPVLPLPVAEDRPLARSIQDMTQRLGYEMPCRLAG